LANVKIHSSAFVDDPSVLGEGTQVWHFCHIMAGTSIGKACIFGQNVFVASGVKVGDNCKIQNNVSLYEGVELENDVFCGPSCVFTNVINPRSQIVRRGEYQNTLVRTGATLGANCTVVCGCTIGRYAFLGAGALVRGDVPDYALMLGVPARQKGWWSRHGFRLEPGEGEGAFVCPSSGWKYQVQPDGTLRCLDWSEDLPLPALT
ncbi:unnamed protein product, partial [Phaeothamnion confervicola]